MAKLLTKFAALPKSAILHRPFVAMPLSPALMLQHYLIHSCIYYEHGKSVITDFEFDSLARDLAHHESSLEEHQHAHLIDWKSLQSGSSGFYIAFPSRVQGAAQWLLDYVSKHNHLPSL